MRERELKFMLTPDYLDHCTSLPVRERELKSISSELPIKTIRSLPVRERELKLVVEVTSAGLAGRSLCGSVN